MKKSLLVLILPLLLTSGCGEQSTPTIAQLSPEDIVIANAHTVQQAAQAFALQNSGRYPRNVDSDTTQSGKTLKDFLPGGLLLVNPFTSARTEPINLSAGPAGQTGYVRGFIDTAYAITGFGSDSLLIILSTLPSWETQVIRNCYTVQHAAEEFASKNNGVYPLNADVDSTALTGETLIDLLPGGISLENPFTNAFTEPILGGGPFTPGQTAYAPGFQRGVITFYTIAGFGQQSLIFYLQFPELLVFPSAPETHQKKF